MSALTVRCVIKQVTPILSPVSLPQNHEAPFVRVTFNGHLTLEQLNAALAPLVTGSTGSSKIHILFDCRNMKSYDTLARERFVEWHKQFNHQLDRVAIVTTNPLWSVVIAAMSLASGHAMKPFSHPLPAEGWLLARNNRD